MQDCAEDLGAVPPLRCPPSCPGLGIPGLRVLRWHRAWEKEGAPYIARTNIPMISVACLSGPRFEQSAAWIGEEEADRHVLWDMLGPGPRRGAAPALRWKRRCHVYTRPSSRLRRRSNPSCDLVLRPLQDLFGRP
jgi:hypothetical protein